MRKKEFFHKPAVRIAAFSTAVLAAAAGAVFLYGFEGRMPCIFYMFTGLYCPGCGDGRAARAILHLDFARAFGYNPLFLVLLPFCMYYVLAFSLEYLFGRRLMPIPGISKKVAIALAVAVLLFWILRNIPVFPFVLLAP